MYPLLRLFRTNLIRKSRRCSSFAEEVSKTKPKPNKDGRYVVTLLTGAGVGPELMGYVQDVFCHADVPVDFEPVEANTMEELDEAIASIKKNGTAIKSSIEILGEDGQSLSPNVRLRQRLDLYLSMVRYNPYCNLAGARHSDVDLILMRQNTEGEYSLLEHESVEGIVECLKVITRSNSVRIAKRTFEYAAQYKRKKVTIVTKANIMKLSDGLFLDEARKIAKEFPDIKNDEMLIDNCCMQMVSNPKQFDVLMMPNLYGSIVGNIMCGLLGGAGLFAGCNYGVKYAIFEPAARTMGKTLVGKNEANPIAMLNAGVELLYHLELCTHAGVLEKAINKTLCEDKVHTPDVGGSCGTTDVVDSVKENIDLFNSQQGEDEECPPC